MTKKYQAIYSPGIGGMGKVIFKFEENSLKHALEDMPREVVKKNFNKFILTDQGCIDFIQTFEDQGLHLGNEKIKGRNLTYEISSKVRMVNEKNTINKILDVCNKLEDKTLENEVKHTLSFN